ncbi:MAG TPA: lipoate--protein ligase family protein [Gemmatimonadaceae bacterium]
MRESPTRWRLLLSEPLDGAGNMALDEALQERAGATRECVLRVYSWRRPTLSLGRNQRALGRYDEIRLRKARLAVVRRPTGGRAVLHHREVTYSVTAPAAAGASLGESYARINRLLCDGLRRLGVAAEVAAGSGRAPMPGEAPCFETPTAGELVLGGRKLAGSAQWRDGGALLQHGSILVDDDQSAVAGLLREPGAPPPRPATLREALGRAPDAAEVARALFDAVRATEDPAAAMLVPDDALLARAATLRARYDDDRWTWRR